MKIESPAAMQAYVGKRLGVSDWSEVDQKMIDLFAEATGDHQWIHVDVERARREMPGGKTIAHGYLLVSLLPRLMAEIFQIEQRSRALNYGSNKVRFTMPVPAGARVRLSTTLRSVEEVTGGRRFTFENILEMAGSERPVLVAETLSISYD